ncbi:hypothetical protein FHP22_14965 [Acinetobacter indicus]|uniref:Uncharacterized protein n=1 Tax=Acinetobacter indicus TaxID=756892 RepID=A0A7S6VQ62_9GAMM|nr:MULTISPECIES: hypothetical protein [Acinetobacter]QFS18668.1 hypothetical protein FHP22_14965 [Acinetobacter indicus]QIC80362.1 hypothetical protein FSC02_15230 [Acinetobacter indicus]QOW42888.1 hypothetical protein G0027_08475 [Acinetobacter indicus]QSG84579.1 hypothetical protein JYB86_15180 [Acinetobacter indicus]RVT55340.1 hypothetical protein ENC21_03065 [Acinetobacter indicus]
MSSIELFVEKELGKKVLSNLKKIHIGGTNNKKGRDYENFFQLFKAFELASQDIDHQKHLLSCQELAFIDDICYWDLENSIKHNFQAKNSSGSAADWSSEITTRCKRQTILDTKFHNIGESRNYLLVSCEKKKTNNLKKVPVRLRKLNTCIFFPYCKTLVELLDQTKLKTYIAELIETDEPSQVDYAAKLILGVLQGTSAQDIKSIFEQACSNASPNPFVKFRKTDNFHREIPDWIKQIVTASSNKLTYRLQSNRIYLYAASGIEVSASLDLILQVSESVIQEITTTKDLAMLFMSLTSRELDDMDTSLDSSPSGGA